VESKDRVSSLLGADGTFPSETAPVAATAKPEDVERELRAQIERALALGIRPTHVDSHMGALFSSPALMATYVKVARAYRLPFLAVRNMPGAPLTDEDIVLDAVIVADPAVPRDRWKEFYVNAVANLKPGLSEIIVHLGHDDAELQAVTVDHEPYGSAWRQRDVDVVASAEFRKALQDNHVVLVTWRELQKLVPQQQP
jgi:predicted glycoside hydrolase/deacetylase ChbG (UPF0249 family)